MTLTQKTQKNPIYERIFLSFMTLSHFWPLEAEKAKTPILTRFWKFRKTSFLYYSCKGEPHDLKFGTNVLGHMSNKIHL